MKWMLYACTILFSFAASAQSSASSSASLIQQFFEALNKHSLDQIAGFAIDTAKIESVNFETATGPSGFREVYSRYFKTSPDLAYQITRINSDDKFVVVEYNSTGTMQNLENTVPAYMQGKKYQLKNCSIFELKNGKISRFATYFDQVAFLRQMGFFEQQK